MRTQCTDLHELITLFRPLYRDQVIFIPVQGVVDAPESYNIELRLSNGRAVLRARGKTVDPFAKGISTGGYKGIAVEMNNIDGNGKALLSELSSSASGTMPFGIPQLSGGSNRIYCEIAVVQLDTAEEELTTERKPEAIEEQTSELRPEDVEEQTSELRPEDVEEQTSELRPEDVEEQTRDARGKKNKLKPLPDYDEDDEEMATAVSDVPPVIPHLPGVHSRGPVVVSHDDEEGTEEVTSLDRPSVSPHSTRAKSAAGIEDTADIPASYALPLVVSKKDESEKSDKAARLPLTSSEQSSSTDQSAAEAFATGSAPRPLSAPIPVQSSESQAYSGAVPTPIHAGYSQQIHQSQLHRAATHTDQFAALQSSPRSRLIGTALVSLVVGLGLGYLFFAGGGENTSQAEEPVAVTKTGDTNASETSDDDKAIDEPTQLDDKSEDEVVGTKAPDELPDEAPDEVPDEATTTSKEPPAVAELTPAFEGSACTGRITSTPARVALFQHGVLLGATPYEGPIQCESLDFEFVLPGFKSAKRQGTLDDDKQLLLDVALERPKYKVVIQTVPRRATVKRNGKFVGRAPVTMFLPAFEPTTIKVLKAGFKPTTQELNLKTPRSVVKVRLPRR